MLLVAGCEINANNPAGFSYTGRDASVVLTDTLVVTGSDTSWSTPMPLHRADRLLIGEYEGFSSLVLAAFTSLPADAVIEEASLTLYRLSSFTIADDPGPLVIRVHPVTADWDTTWTVNDLPGLAMDTFVDDFSLAYDANSDTVGSGLPSSLVQSWVDDPSAAARGVALTTAAFAPWMVVVDSDQASSTRTSRRPRLRIRYSPAGGGASRVESFRADSDLSLISFSGTRPADELWLSRGHIHRTLLTFDFNGLPQDATINRAILRLGIRPDVAIGAPLSLAVAVPASSTPWLDPPLDMIEPGTSSFSLSISKQDSTGALIVNDPLSALVFSGFTDRGLLLFAAAEFSGVGLIRLLDSTAPADRRATLEIVYSRPPGGMQ